MHGFVVGHNVDLFIDDGPRCADGHSLAISPRHAIALWSRSHNDQPEVILHYWWGRQLEIEVRRCKRKIRPTRCIHTHKSRWSGKCRTSRLYNPEVQFRIEVRPRPEILLDVPRTDLPFCVFAKEFHARICALVSPFQPCESCLKIALTEDCDDVLKPPP